MKCSREGLKKVLPLPLDHSGNYEIMVLGLLVTLLLNRTREGQRP